MVIDVAGGIRFSCFIMHLQFEQQTHVTTASDWQYAIKLETQRSDEVAQQKKQRLLLKKKNHVYLFLE